MGKRRKSPYSRFGPVARLALPKKTSPLHFLLSPLSAAGRSTPGGQGRRTSFVCGDLGAGSPTSFDLQPKLGRHWTVDLGLGPLQGMKCKFGGGHVSSGRSPGHSDCENSDRRVWRTRAEEAERLGGGETVPIEWGPSAMTGLAGAAIRSVPRRRCAKDRSCQGLARPRFQPTTLRSVGGRTAGVMTGLAAVAGVSWKDWG